MPFEVRSRSSFFLVRDGTHPDSPVYEVTPYEWIPFESLPAGVHPETGCGDLEVRSLARLPDIRPESFQSKRAKEAEKSRSKKLKARAEKARAEAALAAKNANTLERLAAKEAQAEEAEARAKAQADTPKPKKTPNPKASTRAALSQTVKIERA